MFLFWLHHFWCLNLRVFTLERWFVLSYSIYIQLVYTRVIVCDLRPVIIVVSDLRHRPSITSSSNSNSRITNDNPSSYAVQLLGLTSRSSRSAFIRLDRAIEDWERQKERRTTLIGLDRQTSYYHRHRWLLWSNDMNLKKHNHVKITTTAGWFFKTIHDNLSWTFAICRR